MTYAMAYDKPSISNMLKAAEIKYEIPEGLLVAIAEVESGGNPRAFVAEDGNSGLASHGLLQVQLASAKTVGFKGKSKELMRPDVNIEYGAAYFKWLLETHNKDLSWALTCYNVGVGHRMCKNKKYSNYPAKVLNAYVKYNLRSLNVSN